MRRFLLIAVSWAAALACAAPGAQAVVVDMNAIGQTSIPFNSSNQSGYVGAALQPGTCHDLLGTGFCSSLAAKQIPTVTSSLPCLDPALASDLWAFGQTNRLPDSALCYHNGSVIHKNETFALTWEAPLPSGQRSDWPITRSYVEQFLRDVADGSGTLTSPYALSTQYTDASGRAENSSKYGGGCVDYGLVAGSQCEFSSSTTGHDYGGSGCTPTGVSYVGATDTIANTVCMTDAQIQGEVSSMVTQTGILGRTEPGYTPDIVFMLPPGVDTCLDAAGKLCSANSSFTPLVADASPSDTGGTIAAGTYHVELTYVLPSGESLPGPSETVVTKTSASEIKINSPAGGNGATGWYVYVAAGDGSAYTRQEAAPLSLGSSVTLTSVTSSGAAVPPSFCSYHGQVNVGGTEVPYVVQPWTGQTACDEPDVPTIPQTPTPQELQTDFGIRLASPLSQAQIPSIVDPYLNGWFSLDGAEVNDNGGCHMSTGVDTVPVGSSSQNPYLLQHEYNNAGAIAFDPNTYFGCAPDVLLAPSFVIPSGVNQGDEVQFDGSTTASTLLVPNAGYQWDFGDGSTAVGPSVVHSYAKGGTYTVKLTVTDRGGNVRSLSQTLIVLGPDGLPVPTPTSTGSGSGGSGGTTTGPAAAPALKVRLLLMPQALKAVLRSGIAVRVSTNLEVDGFAHVSISRSAAKRAHIKVGRGASVVIGRGTVARISAGTVGLRFFLSRAIATKLAHLKHVTLTLSLSLITASGDRVTQDAAGHY